MRADAAPAMAEAPGLPSAGHAPGAQSASSSWVDSPQWDVDEVHTILRRWRRPADAYDRDRQFVTEAVLNEPERLSPYVRPDEMHTSSNVDCLEAPWDAAALRSVVDVTLAALAGVGARR